MAERNAESRRKAIVERLKTAEGPLSATLLAKEMGVSRQIIVGDVALLRAMDIPVLATPRGYMLERKDAAENCYVIACQHDMNGMVEELNTVVDNGGAVLDVIVEHAVYGQISGSLQLFSRYDVEVFFQEIRKNKAVPLSDLTGGVHLHTISCPSKEVFERVVEALRQ
ncbi:MAG: transcription repressor NadR, partial [Christensenellaceae bacterium]|nr:transcription repressor NadR [Christensenellaceae bacterium]